MNIKYIGAAIAAAACLAVCAPLGVCAATPEEAAELARQYGYSEDLIQQAWNEYYANPELYPPEVIDAYMEQLRQAGHVIVTTVPHNPDAVVSGLATTAPPSSTTTTASSSAGNNDSDLITLTLPDGSTFTRISREAFIALSYEDKMAYLSTFTPEQQAVFIENLSPEEYRSMLRQLPTDKKAEVVDSLTKITEGLGLTLTVDEITDDNVVIEMKNKDGELVAVGQARDVVENTGYDRRGILAAASALIVGAFAGMFLVVKKCFGKEEDNV